MTHPYRDAHRACPACHDLLHAVDTRLVCERCEGMFAPADDLATAIEVITGVEPGFWYQDEVRGTRACPECAGRMRSFTLRIRLDNDLAKAPCVLDRCAAHGIWFDRDERVAVFSVCRARFWWRPTLER